MTLVDWIEMRIIRSPTGCWLWTGKTAKGYGVISDFRRGLPGKGRTGAHRVTYEIYVGPIPEGLQIDHLCRVTRCVNPEHLEPVTALVNVRRAAPDTCRRGHPLGPFIGLRKRRCRPCHTIGERTRRRRNGSPEQRLIDTELVARLRDEGLLQKEIAARLGVARPSISKVLSRLNGLRARHLAIEHGYLVMDGAA